MQKKILVHLLLLILACLVATMSTAAAKSSKASIDEQRTQIRELSQATLERLYKKYPNAERVINNCYGYATFSNTGVKLLLISTGHGRGLAVNNETGEEVFMKMKEVGAGIGAGAKEFDLVFVFDNLEAWNKFISGQTKFGGQASATATDGTSGGAIEGAALASDGIWIYQMTTKGLSLEATLNGTKYYTDKKLNQKDKDDKATETKTKTTITTT